VFFALFFFRFQFMGFCNFCRFSFLSNFLAFFFPLFPVLSDGVGSVRIDFSSGRRVGFTVFVRGVLMEGLAVWAFAVSCGFYGGRSRGCLTFWGRGLGVGFRLKGRFFFDAECSAFLTRCVSWIHGVA